MPAEKTVLIFQGGGALGAYQAGVFEQLHANDFQLDWLIGTSIGAINCALIAGNPPETRVQQLKAFWRSLSPPMASNQTWSPFSLWMDTLISAKNAWTHLGGSGNNSADTLNTLSNGVPGFFIPRIGASWDINAKVPLDKNSFYDTTPLKATLEKYIDFDYLNRGDIRVSVCAVEMNSGQIRQFDSKHETITVEHIMASGALPPGFPPVEVDGKMYWDGGIYSNTPLEVLLDEESKQDILCFMVDLWDPTEDAPQSIAEALARYKNIQYASRSKEQLQNRKKIQDLQKALRLLNDLLPESEKNKVEIQKLTKLGCTHTVKVIHLIMKALPDDHYFKDIDFSASTISQRWEAGLRDAKRALKQKAWMKPTAEHAGLIIHELKQE